MSESRFLVNAAPEMCFAANQPEDKME